MLLHTEEKDDSMESTKRWLYGVHEKMTQRSQKKSNLAQLESGESKIKLFGRRKQTVIAK